MLTISLTELAIRAGAPPPAAADAASRAQTQNLSPIQFFLGIEGVEEKTLLSLLANELGLPFVDRVNPLPDKNLLGKVPSRLAITHALFPNPQTQTEKTQREETPPEADESSRDSNVLSDTTEAEPHKEDAEPFYLLTSDPLDFASRQAAAIIEVPFRWAVAPRSQILAALRSGYGIGAETFEELLAARGAEKDVRPNLLEETNILDSDDSEASVVKFVNQIINAALDDRATDIHIEPLADDLRIRYRVDGVLQEAQVPQRIKELQDSLISRIKIMANLDIAERRLPQDGRIPLQRDGVQIDVRVACIPSVTGESISLRLLGQESYDFRRLGLEPEDENNVRSLLAMPNGIVLLTGPTGCGKSTTLYTFLSQLNTKDRRIVTIEDPVERKLPGVVQIAVKHDINLGFAEGLRSILRSDPNVIMVGEMRDFETAEIAIRAALTGHLVFSTLHTNDSTGGITRLIDMGVEPFLVASSVRAFIAQRLVRLLCPHCKTLVHHPDSYLDDIAFPASGRYNIYGPVGCDRCRQTGYIGRRAIYEICLVTPEMQELITERKQGSVLRSTAIAQGMTPLRQAGWKKVLDGLTSIEEVVRVTTADVDLQDE